MRTVCATTEAHAPLWTLRAHVEAPPDADPRHDLCGHWGSSTVPVLGLYESDPGEWCGTLAVEPECVVVAAQWVGPGGLTGEVVTLPEPAALLAGLVLLGVIGRRRPGASPACSSRGSCCRRSSRSRSGGRRGLGMMTNADRMGRGRAGLLIDREPVCARVGGDAMTVTEIIALADDYMGRRQNRVARAYGLGLRDSALGWDPCFLPWKDEQEQYDRGWLEGAEAAEREGER